MPRTYLRDLREHIQALRALGEPVEVLSTELRLFHLKRMIPSVSVLHPGKHTQDGRSRRRRLAMSARKVSLSQGVLSAHRRAVLSLTLLSGALDWAKPAALEFSYSSRCSRRWPACPE
jgi:hypothetical protein